MAEEKKNENVRLHRVVGEQIARISELEDQLRRQGEEKDAEIALLDIEIDKLQNPEEPKDTHFGEKNEA